MNLANNIPLQIFLSYRCKDKTKIQCLPKQFKIHLWAVWNLIVGSTITYHPFFCMSNFHIWVSNDRLRLTLSPLEDQKRENERYICCFYLRNYPVNWKNPKTPFPYLVRLLHISISLIYRWRYGWERMITIFLTRCIQGLNPYLYMTTRRDMYKPKFVIITTNIWKTYYIEGILEKFSIKAILLLF